MGELDLGRAVELEAAARARGPCRAGRRPCGPAGRGAAERGPSARRRGRPSRSRASRVGTASTLAAARPPRSASCRSSATRRRARSRASPRPRPRRDRSCSDIGVTGEVEPEPVERRVALEDRADRSGEAEAAPSLVGVDQPLDLRQRLASRPPLPVRRAATHQATAAATASSRTADTSQAARRSSAAMGSPAAAAGLEVGGAAPRRGIARGRVLLQAAVHDRREPRFDLVAEASRPAAACRAGSTRSRRHRRLARRRRAGR